MFAFFLDVLVRPVAGAVKCHQLIGGGGVNTQRLLANSVGFVKFLKQVMLHFCVLDLLLAVQVHGMVVSHELVPFEKLDRCLVQLDHYDLVQ